MGGEYQQHFDNISIFLQVFDILMESSHLAHKLLENTKHFRSLMNEAGFTIGVS